MPWYFGLPEFLKKRACRYLLQHYLGQFLEERICLEDLTVDLYNGTGSIHNIPLNVQAINDALKGVGTSIQVLSGFIECVTVSVPWAALLKENCMVKLSGLTLTVAPHGSFKMEEYMTMTDSLFFSMSSSRQLAEEVLRGGPVAGEGGGEATSGFEGMETLARAIELVLARVQVCLMDTMIQVDYQAGALHPTNLSHFLRLRIKRMEFYDEVSQVESSVDSPEVETSLPPVDYAVKLLHLSDLSVELGSSGAYPENDDVSSSGSDGVPVAMAGGKLTVKVTIKQTEEVPGPKLAVDGFLGSLHLLLSPQQLGLLLQMAKCVVGQAGNGVHQSGLAKLCPGQSRPIPHVDRSALESQLAQHQQHERQAEAQWHLRPHDLLTADPWDDASFAHGSTGPVCDPFSAATPESDEQFYSLDLTSSFTSSTMPDSMEESQLPPLPDDRKVGPRQGRGIIHRQSARGDEAVLLHEGVGLQQLSSSPSQTRREPLLPSPSPYPLHHPTSGSHPANASGTNSNHSRFSGSSRHPLKPNPLCKYSLTVNGMTMALLEADPVHIYTARLNKQLSPKENTAKISPTSMDEGGLDPVRYFELVTELMAEGLNWQQYQQHQKQLAQILPADHLLVWLCVLRASVNLVEEQAEFDLTLAGADVWEHLYHNHTPHINIITKPVSVCPIILLQGDQQKMPPKPCLKLKLSSCPDRSHKRKSQHPVTLTDVCVALSTVQLNIDPTLVDRLQLLMATPPTPTPLFMQSSSLDMVKQSLYMTSSNIHTIQQQRQLLFHQAQPALTASPPSTKLSLKVSGDKLHMSLRFPVPQNRKTQHPPWFRPSLRSAVLFMELVAWQVSSQLHPLALTGDASYTIKAQFSDAQVFLSNSGSPGDRELFLVISSKSGEPPTHNSSLEAVHIIVDVQPEPDRSLELKREEHVQQLPYILDLLGEESSEDQANTALPFSRKHSMFSARHQEEAGQGGDIHSEELILPGSVLEMDDFEQQASATACYSIKCCVPEIRVHLPSKHFLETLYNRFMVDLALWEPASPAAVSKANAKSVLYSYMDLLQPAATSEDRFLMCKSALKEEGSDEEDGDDEGGAFRMGIDGMECGHDESSRELSYFSLAVTIDEGVVSMFPEVLESASENGISVQRDVDVFKSATSGDPTLVELGPDQLDGDVCNSDRVCGVAILDISDLRCFYVSGYRGDPTHHYACTRVQDATLYHCGNPGGCGTTGCASVDKTFDLSVCTHLLPIFSSKSSKEQPMLSLAMEVQSEREHTTVTRKVAVALYNTSLFYHVTPTGCGVDQLGAFLDLKEEEVDGIEVPSLVTELHTHMINCSLEYRPLYLPLVATMVLDSISMSTSIVTGAPVHVLNMVLDGAYLLLTATKPTPSHKQFSKPPFSSSSHSSSPSSLTPGHSVCVMEVEWFELTLRHCNNSMLNEDVQKFLADMSDVCVECTSNVIHFRMCSDSCIALRDLLTYLSSHQDLQPRSKVKGEGDDSWDYFSIPLPSASTTPSTSATEDFSVSSNSNSLSHNFARDRISSGEIGDLISDAMQDTPPSATHKGKGKRRKEEWNGSFGPPRAVAVQDMGESLVMDFDSDSDDDGFMPPRHDGGRGTQSGGCVQPSGRTTGKQADLEHEDIFSDNDDDFCIVDTPTTTKVAPGAKPIVKCLLEDGEEVEVVDDHFSIPDGKMNHLQRPPSFPLPQSQYTLKEMTIICYLYGGKDFVWSSNAPPRGTGKSSGTSAARGICSTASWRLPRARLRDKYDLDLQGRSWKLGGGPERDHSVLVEVELHKVCRLVLLIGDVEVRDRLAHSDINKLLYQYTTELMPRQSHASMISLKVLFTRPELDDHQEEASVQLSILPIRLNLDQDTVLFVYSFIQQAGNSKHLEIFDCEGASQEEGHSAATVPVTISSHSSKAKTRNGDERNPDTQVFIRSFEFNPDLPIRIDYEAKGFKTDMGAVAGFLLGLSHLNTSEVSLKALHYKKGLLGWDKLLEYSTDEWLKDIASYQLPLLFKGVGPLNSFSQLVSGIFKFVQLPCLQYQQDGRVVKGLQRGASALTSSTGVAVVELTSQLLEAVQALAQMAYDFVSPIERVPHSPFAHYHKPHHPVDFREGISNAYGVVSTGLGHTATNLVNVASREHQERGAASAVGTVLRHIPGTLVQPIILASEATRHVLGGVKNQFDPDARKEAYEKWKSHEPEDKPPQKRCQKMQL